MKERLEAILKNEKITPSKLADLIGVQRSGISHIMSGRNKPGLDFLSKLLIQFPHINGDWLITGNGPMLKTAQKSPNKPSFSQMSIPIEAKEERPKVRIKPQVKDEEPTEYNRQPVGENPIVEAVKTDGSKEIDRIIVFYKDRSFREYRPD